MGEYVSTQMLVSMLSHHPVYIMYIHVHNETQRVWMREYVSTQMLVSILSHHPVYIMCIMRHSEYG